jgi:hypothetical protein
MIDNATSCHTIMLSCVGCFHPSLLFEKALEALYIVIAPIITYNNYLQLYILLIVLKKIVMQKSWISNPPLSITNGLVCQIILVSKPIVNPLFFF